MRPGAITRVPFGRTGRPIYLCRNIAVSAPPAPSGQKTFVWQTAAALAGRRFATEDEVDSALQEVGDDLKRRIRDGFIIDTI